MAVLALDRVTKRYGDFTAVDDLSFEAPEGRVFGFLGGNGAGKTTSLRMVLDILRPTSGRIEVFGGAPGRMHAERMGFLPEERGLYRKMTALETVIYFGTLKGMSRSAAKAEGERLLTRFGLDAWSKQPVDRLSKGMAQKIQLAAAIVNKPALLILDEPFSGLDPVNQTALEEAILEFRTAGSTVVFSTHIMQHAERLCDELLFLKNGRKVFQGTQGEARAKLPSRVSLSARRDPSGLPGVASARSVGDEGDGWSRWELELAPGAAAGTVLQACVREGVELADFEQRRPTLHEVFLALVGDEAVTAR